MNLLNQLRALSVRRVEPWSGVWFADVDVQLDDTGIVPSGKCVLTLGTVPLIGTIDPRASGSYGGGGPVGGGKAKLRVIGGGAGWDQQVRRLAFHNDAAVLSTAVYSATGAEVGEAVVDVVPKPLGIDYVRSAGPASRVFAGVDWYMTPAGVTTVGPRIPIPMDPTSVDILSWDPKTSTVELSSDDPIVPGTILVDSAQRFSGTLTVRDVEQTWDESGARVVAWCGESKGARLMAALGAVVAEKAGIVYLKTYEYRVVAQAPDERLALQAVAIDAGVPDMLPISTWFGIPGLSAKLLQGSIVLVEFIQGDPTRPTVRAFQGGTPPISLELDVSIALSINGGKRPVAALGDFAGPFPIAATGVSLQVP